ncbi:hypothetical protein EV426DRAFT_625171 [Tirmania nivea]|nr:hypothetical protein EV426DRAFT_625171 [Tirmania nivea]
MSLHAYITRSNEWAERASRPPRARIYYSRPRPPALLFGRRSHPPEEIWKVFAPTRGETLGDWGILGEWTFGDFPEEILMRIAVPPAAAVSSGSKGTDFCCCWRRILGKCIPPDMEFADGLQRLPIDLFWMVFDYLGLDDLYALFLTTPLLAHITTPVLRSRFRETLGTWENTPLLVMKKVMSELFRHTNPDEGSWLEHLRPSLREQLENFVRRRVSLDVPAVNEIWVDVSESVKLPQLPGKYQIHTEQRCCEQQYYWMEPTYGNGWRYPKGVLSRVQFFPENKEYVLRNLTKKLFVRGNGLTSTQNAGVRARHPRWGWGFGHVVAAHVVLGYVNLWELLGWKDDKAHNRYEWAGDEFDVRLWEEVEDELVAVTEDENCWRDVTMRARVNLEDLWSETERKEKLSSHYRHKAGHQNTAQGLLDP